MNERQGIILAVTAIILLLCPPLAAWARQRIARPQRDKPTYVVRVRGRER